MRGRESRASKCTCMIRINACATTGTATATTHGLGFILGRSAFLVGTGHPPPPPAPAPAPAAAPSLVAALLLLLWALALPVSPAAASEALDGAGRDNDNNNKRRRVAEAARREVTILPLSLHVHVRFAWCVLWFFLTWSSKQSQGPFICNDVKVMTQKTPRKFSRASRLIFDPVKAAARQQSNRIDRSEMRHNPVGASRTRPERAPPSQKFGLESVSIDCRAGWVHFVHFD